MEQDQFLTGGTDALKYLVEVLERRRSEPLLFPVQPGYLRDLIPEEASEAGDSWENVLNDVERVIVPGRGIQSHPNYYAVDPVSASYPSIVGSVLTNALQIMPNSWESTPAGTELEVMMMDWLGKMLHLPPQFLTDSGGSGGGVLNSSGSMNTLLSMLSARTWAIEHHRPCQPDDDLEIVSKMVAYSSMEANLSLQKAGSISMIRVRKLETGGDFAMSGHTLRTAIRDDKARGLIPMFVCATLGSNGPCSFDNLAEIGPICEAEDVWLHVDAGYAGNYCICPEFRPLLDGVQFARSIFINLNETLQVNDGCSAMWVSDRNCISETFKSSATYLSPQMRDRGGMPNYRDWQFDLSRQCRSIKVWLVIRLHGVKGLQDLARKDVILANQFATLVRHDPRFETIGEVSLGVVCFRLKRCNDTNRGLLKAINKAGRIILGETRSRGIFYLRLHVKATKSSAPDMEFAWRNVEDAANKLLAK